MGFKLARLKRSLPPIFQIITNYYNIHQNISWRLLA